MPFNMLNHQRFYKGLRNIKVKMCLLYPVQVNVYLHQQSVSALQFTTLSLYCFSGS